MSVTVETELAAGHSYGRTHLSAYTTFHNARNMYLTFLEYDGNLLRRELISCNRSSTSDTLTSRDELQGLDEDDPCYEFRRGNITRYRTHLNYMEFDYESTQGGFRVLY